MRITAYADRLSTTWTGWTGRTRSRRCSATGSAGPRARRCGSTSSVPRPAIEVFTTRPDTLFGATYMVLAPEHPLVDADRAGAWPDGHRPRVDRRRTPPRPRRSPPTAQAAAGKSDAGPAGRSKEKTGVFTGALRHQPGQRQRDPGLRRRLRADGLRHRRDHGRARPGPARLGVRRGLRPADHPHGRSRPTGWEGEAFTGDGPAINSHNDEISLDGLGVAEAKRGDHRLAGRARAPARRAVQYKLRDWLFSRQRYWGEPFPIVYDEHGAPIALPDDQLPVELPEIDDYSPKTFDPDDADTEPEPPLCRADGLGRTSSWTWATGRRRYRRETNTMPQWAGSCWYYLRYLDPTNDKYVLSTPRSSSTGWRDPSRPGDPGGVDLYVGGVEHAVLHLLYARFWHKVLYDLGHVVRRGAVPAAVQPGLHPGVRLHRRPRQLRAGRGGRRVAGRWFHVERRTGHPRVREDGQVAEERGHPGRDVRALRRRHLPAVRDVDGPAGRVPAVGDPGRRRVAAVPAAGLAHWSTRPPATPRVSDDEPDDDDPAAAAPHHRRGAHRLRGRCASTPPSPS